MILSEACIPLHNFTIVYHYISESQYSFIGSLDEDGPYGRGRYNEGMAPEVNITEWRKGSQWFEINRKLAIDIVEDKKLYPKFEQFCRPACYVDEHYFPTMLRWTGQGAVLIRLHLGRLILKSSFSGTISKAQRAFTTTSHRQVCFLFARKFAPNAFGPLLEIAPYILGFG